MDEVTIAESTVLSEAIWKKVIFQIPRTLLSVITQTGSRVNYLLMPLPSNEHCPDKGPTCPSFRKPQRERKNKTNKQKTYNVSPDMSLGHFSSDC